MENITRTVYGATLQTATLLGKTPKIHPLSTLNTKFGIQADVLPTTLEVPVMKYMAIGIGGHTYTVGANGIPKPEPVQHRSRDAACYVHLPFVLREINNDLSVEQRKLYALRRPETIKGIAYYAYYVRRIPLDDAEIDVEYVTSNGDQEIPSPFEPDSGDLNPTPPVIGNTGVNTVTNDYLQVTSKLDLSLNAFDVTELKNVARVLYDDENFSIVSEVAMCSGVDKQVNTTGPGNSTISFNEAIGVQIVSHINAFYPLQFSPSGVEIIVDAGASEPLFQLTNVQ